MGFYKIDYAIMDFLKQDGLVCEKVLEFGSQDIREDRDGIHQLQRVSAKSIYDSYGFSTYKCIDMDGAHNALLFDLGKNLNQEYGFVEQFNLVTIKEIGHWIFDQKTLFENIHNATKEDGYIIWRSPIVCGYGAGCFVYMPNKILQLGFCNSYLYRGAWIHRQIVGNDTCYDVQKFENGSAYNFLDHLKDYVTFQRNKNSGEYVLRLTIVFKKLGRGGGAFISPFFPYTTSQEAIVRNAKMVLLNCFPKICLGKIVIFGTGEAARLAYLFADKAGLEVEYFVDDFKKGEFCKRSIIKWEEFVERQSEYDFLLCGPYQQGNILQRSSKIPIRFLKMEWFV